MAKTKLEAGQNYLPYFDSNLNIETYTYVTDFCDFFESKPEEMDTALLPISDIGNGDYLCLKTSQENLPVYYWCHELSDNNEFLVVDKLADLPDKLVNEEEVSHLE
ncbi:MAG: SMI1/KNR4 family protein [Alphaproteobacteria bacterium]|nr:MAG: SMI1/KNR4 family protein [Alphaproteobacteria bacterium]